MTKATPRPWRRLIVAGAIAALFVGLLPAEAEARRANKKLAQAKALYSQAETHYNLGQFPQALAKYSKAYALVKLPGFLFNIGQCHRMLGNLEKAIFFYRGYLRGGRQVANRALVQRLLKAAIHDLAAKRKAAERRRLLELRKLEALKRLKPRTIVKIIKPGVVTPPTIKIKTPVYKRWWFWTVIAVAVAGAVGAGVGVALTQGTKTVLPEGSLGVADRR